MQENGSSEGLLCRQAAQDWGGLAEVDEEYNRAEGRQGESMWKTGVNPQEEREVGLSSRTQ